MSALLDKLAEHTNIEKDTLETELYAALRALEIDPEKMTLEELRQCLMLYLDEVFYDASPDKVH